LEAALFQEEAALLQRELALLKAARKPTAAASASVFDAGDSAGAHAAAPAFRRLTTKLWAALLPSCE